MQVDFFSRFDSCHLDRLWIYLNIETELYQKLCADSEENDEEIIARTINYKSMWIDD